MVGHLALMYSTLFYLLEPCVALVNVCYQWAVVSALLSVQLETSHLEVYKITQGIRLKVLA